MRYKPQNMTAHSNSLPAYQAPLLCLVAAGFCGVLAASQVVEYRRIEAEVAAAGEWVETPCVVTLAQPLPAGRNTAPRLALSFEYVFGGESYEGETYRLGATPHLLFDDADWFAEKHPAGTELVCYVNPADPAEAVLNRTNVENPTGWLAFFGVATAFWLLLALLSFRRRRPAPATPPDSAV